MIFNDAAGDRESNNRQMIMHIGDWSCQFIKLVSHGLMSDYILLLLCIQLGPAYLNIFKKVNNRNHQIVFNPYEVCHTQLERMCLLSYMVGPR